MNASVRRRNPAVLVAPGITFVAVLFLVGLAGVYDGLPVRAPECGFKGAFGIPCVSCGGTRSMQSLAAGRLREALAYNPAVVLGVAASAAWLGLGWFRYRNHIPPPTPAQQSRRVKTATAAALVLLLLNWIYLVRFLG